MKERISQRNYVFEAYKQSQFAPREKVFDRSRSCTLCPRCSKRLPWLDHGEFTVCGSCGLRIQSWGGALELSEGRSLLEQLLNNGGTTE